MNADGSGQRNLTRNPRRDDGSCLVARRAEDRLRQPARRRRATEVYVMNADGSGQRNLTRNPAARPLPGRPTGGRSPSSATATATLEIYVMNADGSGQRNLTRYRSRDARACLVARAETVSVTAPPRPPRPSDPVDREELEALVEALIEEARQRARRRRRIYGVSVTLGGAGRGRRLDRRRARDTAGHGFPALAARSSGLAAAATSKIAFIREPLHMGYAGVLWVMNADGSEQRRLAPAHPGMR